MTPALGAFWRLFPLLGLYLALNVYLDLPPGQFQGDESRYVMYAENLAQGYYSPQGQVFLWNGPGYPLVLLPLALLHIPWRWATLLNPLFLFGAVLFLHQALRRHLSPRAALAAALLFGLYPLNFNYLGSMLTENLVVFLVCGFLYAWLSARVWLAGSFLAALALVKIFFGYLLMLGLAVSLPILLVRRGPLARRAVGVHLLALLLCLPWLVYTHQLTGKFFYWGSPGGIALYWMSSPFPGDLGDQMEFSLPLYADSPSARFNVPLFQRLDVMDTVSRDQTLLAAAIDNIKSHPGKFVLNWLANLGRMLFSYPFSYTPQKLSTYVIMLPNMFLVVLATFCVWPMVRAWRRVPSELWVIFLWGVAALGGSSLVTAFFRHFLPVAPVVWLWVAYPLGNLVTVTWKNDGNNQEQE